MVATARPRRTLPKSPAQIADAEVARGKLTDVERQRRRARAAAHECTVNWADDIYFGHDVDYLGVPRGHGYAKVRCCSCERDTPPQDCADRAYRDWADAGRPGLPPSPDWVCTDCRTRAPVHRARKTADGDVTRQRYMDDRGAIWEEDPDAVYPDDGSPMAAALEALENRNAVLADGPLPTEDADVLLAGVEAYRATGDLSAFVKLTGDESIAKIQRERYGATRTVVA